MLLFVRSKRVAMSHRNLVQTGVIVDDEEVVLPFCVGECPRAAKEHCRGVGGCRNMRNSWSASEGWNE